PRAAAPSLPSGVRSSAAAWPRGPRDGRRWDRAEKTARTRAAAGRVRSCAGAGEIFDEPLLHDFLGLHEPHPFVPPIFEQLLRDWGDEGVRRVETDEGTGKGGGNMRWIGAAPWRDASASARWPAAACGRRW